MDNDKTLSVFEDLIETCKDGQEGISGRRRARQADGSENLL